jgi:hypothetical protein
MAYVMALQQGWSTTDIKFKVNNDIHGLIDSVNDGSTSAFMWEHFTTKPWVDAGKARFIGNVPTPWPSWLIAAHPVRAPADAVRTFLAQLTDYVARFDSQASRDGPNVEYIKGKFGYPEEDIQAWLKTVGYPLNCGSIPTKVIEDTFSLLEKAGVVKAPQSGFDIGTFVNTDICSLT